MSEIDNLNVAAELEPESAERDISHAVSARHKVAHGYVARLRRRHPDASPAEIIDMLERHYITAITVAGGVITAGTIAANVGIALIPGAAAGKEVSKSAVKVAGKKAATAATKTAVAKATARKAAKAAAKRMAEDVATSGAQRAVKLLPAGDAQLQFEITAVFALAMAELHSLPMDRDQALTLVYGLTNDRVSQALIADMAKDVAESADPATEVGRAIATGREDWSHWANTLADALPGGAAQDLMRTVQTGELETVRTALGEKQQTTIEYGIGALTGGVTRFVFGREVVKASRLAFAEAPDNFPEHLSAAALAKAEEEREPNRALSALEDAAKTTSEWVAAAADKSTRVFRSVDLDGDGIPDEPQALTALKGAGGAIGGAVSSGSRAFRSVDRDGDGIPDEPQALSALKGARDGVAARFKGRNKDADENGPRDSEDVE